MLGKIGKPERSAAAAEPRREKMRRARDMYRAGWKLVKIAAEIGVPPGTVRRWKCVHRWADEVKKARQESESACDASTCGEVPGVLAALDTPALTGKQSLFVIYYAKSHNATRSYQRAYGCSYASALVRGPVLAGKPEIRSAARRVAESMFSRAFLTPDDIFQKFIEIAFADITDFVEFEGRTVRLRPSSEVDGTLLRSVSCGKGGFGVKLMDRLKALQWLSDHLGPDTDEQRARVAKLRAQTERIQRGSGSGEALDDDPVTKALKASCGLVCVPKEGAQNPGGATSGSAPAASAAPINGARDAAPGSERGNGPGWRSCCPGQPRGNAGGIFDGSVSSRKGCGNAESKKRESG